MRRIQFTSVFSFLLTLCCLGYMPIGGQAQAIDFGTPVSFSYEGRNLESVLDDLSARYGIGFSYSRQIIPVHQKIYASANHLPCGEALSRIFEQTQVIYGVIGDQLVLSIDTKKTPVYPDLGYLSKGEDDSLASLSAAYPERLSVEVSPLTYHAPPLAYSTVRISSEEVAYDLRTQVRNAEEQHAHVRAQVTFLPPLKYDTDRFSDEPVNFSLNVLGGMNSSIQGVEIGGLVNFTRKEVVGLQAAGLVNVVGDSLQGIQLAGLVNVIHEESEGFQAAGLVNIAGGSIHAQTSGLANVAHGDVSGQAAGLFNIARNVHGGQFAGLVNVAKKVSGVQVGLFNFADSVGAVPLGLISYVHRRGYHSIEFGAEDAIDYNMNLRLGVRAFYNILHVGLDDEAANWSLGYGIGTSFWLARRNYLQLEILARQINEDETWTNELNLLSQVRMSYDFALTKNIRVALGPSFNILTSRRYNEETGTYGSDVARYTIFDHTYDDGFRTPLNVKYWVGLHAGIRFGSADTHPPRPD